MNILLMVNYLFLNALSKRVCIRSIKKIPSPYIVLSALLSKNCNFSFLICSFKKVILKIVSSELLENQNIYISSHPETTIHIYITKEKRKKKHICFTKIANLQLFEKKTDSEFLVLELDPGSRGQENNWLPDRFKVFLKLKFRCELSSTL